MSIAQEISEALFRANMTQRDFARRLGISPQYVSDILRGRRPISPRIAVRIELVTGFGAADILYAQAMEEVDKIRRETAP